MTQQQAFEDTFVLVYGMACPLRCDFCCHPVEEYGAIKMQKEEVIDWISQAATVPSIRLVIFTGGEPFVYYRDLLAILQATRAHGLPVRIVTAAHWAKSVAEAKAKLLPLRDAGLTELSVSTDPSHQAFVPAAFAENAVEAAQSLGIVTELAGVFWDPDTQVEDIVRVSPGSKTTRHLAIPIGRSKDRKVTPADYRLGEERFLGCGQPRSFDITVYPNGEVYPCCSGGFNIQARLSFGNLKRDALAEVVERIHADRYTRLVMEAGFLPIYTLARFKYPEIAAKLPDWHALVSPCQLCAVVHSNSALLAALEPVLAYVEKVIEAATTLGADMSCRPEVPRG